MSDDSSSDDADSGIPYEQLISRNDSHDPAASAAGVGGSSQVLMNYVAMSILFSANHGAMVSCLAFSTLQFGSTGAWELSLLHLIYAASALLGSTYVVKQLGARNSMALGMALYATYVSCFWCALQWRFLKAEFATIGAIMGGIGGGFLWTAQGSYFGRASTEYAGVCVGMTTEKSTSVLAGIFAFIYLVGEVGCKLLSWAMLETNHSTWNKVIGVYTIVAITSTVMMLGIHNYAIDPVRNNSTRYKLTAALQLLIRNPRMKYMIGLNAVFGLACPFVNSFVNGEVVRRVFIDDSNLGYVGLLSALSAAVAATCSLVFGALPHHKGAVLILGAFSFAMVVLPFLIQQDFSTWGWRKLIMIYTFQGIGRSTFEGALRAVFADYFAAEKEGAFANIILHNGFFTALGFFLSFYVPCSRKSSFCFEFKEGGLHNILVLEVAVLVSAIAAVLGYWRAAYIFKMEHILRNESTQSLNPLLEHPSCDAELGYLERPESPGQTRLRRSISYCVSLVPGEELSTNT